MDIYSNKNMLTMENKGEIVLYSIKILRLFYKKSMFCTRL